MDLYFFHTSHQNSETKLGTILESIQYYTLKFIYSEKATTFCEISTVDLSYVVPVKSTVEISQNFVDFSEYMNFKNQSIWKNSQNNLKTYYLLKVFQFNIYLHILLLLLIFPCRMNLFLGVFVPNKNRPALWDRDAPQDVYLHSPEICRSVGEHPCIT